MVDQVELREVRVRQIPNRFDGKIWHTADQPLVRLGDVGRWSMVRRADIPGAAPFVISRKEWDKLPHPNNTGEV
jgi:hypothetical protein